MSGLRSAVDLTRDNGREVVRRGVELNKNIYVLIDCV